LQADEPIDRGALDGCLALELESDFEKEIFCGLEVVNDDEDVIHPFKCHSLLFLAALLMSVFAAK
jgi:hypothetical protein